MEEARKKEHLKQVAQRQQVAEQQIVKLEAELAEEQRKKEQLVCCHSCPSNNLSTNNCIVEQEEYGDQTFEIHHQGS